MTLGCKGIPPSLSFSFSGLPNEWVGQDMPEQFLKILQHLAFILKFAEQNRGKDEMVTLFYFSKF